MHQQQHRIRASRNADSGFNLVELAVTIVIIGILVAIAVPVFTQIQRAGEISALKSDLVAAAAQLERDRTADNHYVATAMDLSTSDGFETQTSSAIEYCPNEELGGYCLEGSLKSNPDTKLHFVWDGKDVAEGGCSESWTAQTEPASDGIFAFTVTDPGAISCGVYLYGVAEGTTIQKVGSSEGAVPIVDGFVQAREGAE